MIPLMILGAGGTARDILDWLPSLAAAGREYHCLGLLDDDAVKHGTVIDAIPVIGRLNAASKWPRCRFADALGGPRSYRQRAGMLARTALTEDRFETIVHPLACVSSRAEVGAGCVIYPFVFVGPNVRIGRHVTILSHSSINHDCVIGNHSILAAHTVLAGGVRLDDDCYVGMGATVIGDTAIGRGAMIGMGSVVRHEVPAEATVVGNVALPLRPRKR